jgi:two-component system sensor histidine kinase ChvG
VLILLPALLYSIFWRIENERRNLLVSAVRDAGTAIAAGLAPELQALQPVDFDSLDSRLARFADPHRRITLLFHPAGSAAAEQFFFVAGVPPVSVEQLGRERERLVSLGVLNGLVRSCAGGTPLAERVTAEDGASAVITSITGVAGTAGCWAIVIVINSSDEVAGIVDRPAEVSRELKIAALVYAVMAGLILAIFVSVRANLRRFRNQALAIGADGRFLDVTDVPEMVPVARAIDAMVHRLKDTAEMCCAKRPKTMPMPSRVRSQRSAKRLNRCSGRHHTPSSCRRRCPPCRRRWIAWMAWSVQYGGSIRPRPIFWRCRIPAWTFRYCCTN